MYATHDMFLMATPSPAFIYSDGQQAIIREAIGILETRLKKTEAFTCPSVVKNFCPLHLGAKKNEFFCCLFLDSQHRLTVFEQLFRGTIDGASVYLRIVVRRSLELNAVAERILQNYLCQGSRSHSC
ncbi:MAG: DNA repair protein RadC [Porticoccus sp.]|jgi:DNA repair protein RadC